MQRDLLPLIEGTTVSTKYGPVKTDHVLFIASGAFHLAKPSDLLPELQGRLPIRVELAALSRDDLRRILTEPEHSLMKQYAALMATERVTLIFTDDAVDALAELAADINDRVENIGARRLHTVLERLLEEISFTATDRGGRDDHGGRGLRERARGAAGAEGRSEPVHPVIRHSPSPAKRGRAGRGYREHQQDPQTRPALLEEEFEAQPPRASFRSTKSSRSWPQKISSPMT